MSIETRRFPMPGEPLAVYVEWISTIPEFDYLSKEELRKAWKIRSAKEFKELMQSRQFRQYGDLDIVRSVDSVTVRGALEGQMEVLGKDELEQEYHRFN